MSKHRVKRSRTYQFLVRELEALGVDDYTVEDGGKHHFIHLRINGGSKKLYFTTTKTDFRGVKNSVAFLRQMVKEMRLSKEEGDRLCPPPPAGPHTY